MKKRPFNFIVRAQADGEYEIGVRGIIGQYFDAETFSMSDTEQDVLNELNQIPAGKKINVRVNSIGGVVQYGLGIYNALARRKGDVTTYNDGFACSAAAIVMLAGDRRVCPPASMMMIHNASGGGEGTAKDMRTIADCLDTIDDVQASTLAMVSGKKTKAEFAAMLAATTWMTGEQAVECGLATECAGEVEDDEPDATTAKAELELAGHYKNAPKNLLERLNAKAQAATPPPTPQPQPKVKSMKKITAALVAAGLITASTEEQTEDSLLPQINAVLAENKRLKTENESHVTARKNRVTAALDLAVTDKVIAETRKAGLLGLGTATAEGETEVLAQLAELREAKAVKAPRGAAPVPRAQGGGEADTIESLLEEQAEAMKGTDGDLLASINAKLAEKRGRKDLFKPADERRAFNN